MRRWFVVIGILLAAWLGFRYFASAARFTLEECVAALESVYPDVFAGLPENADLRQFEFDDRRAGIAAALRASGETAAAYLELMLDRSARGRIARVSSVLDADTAVPVLAWEGLGMCSTLPQTACPLTALEDHMLRLDGGNGEVWAQIAANRYERGESAAALEALDWAARSPESNAYWAEAVSLAEGLLAEHTALDSAWRLNQAFGIAAARPLAYRAELLAICREQAALDEAWAGRCRAYGRTLERQSRTRRGQDFGIGLQLAVARVTGDDDGVAALAMRETRLAAAGPAVWQTRVVAAMLRAEPALLPAYLDLLRRQGETAAAGSFIAQELEAVLEPADLAACGPTMLQAG